ncbi:hypothetical protein FNH22_12955 [Fulvivirga sp. M361]|uniref:hypothetical protein n=1 Tax=Fulvivirga sp. M361 TaxID=2594266 RepID=UPI001179B23D|nr:hypothetical protein [Fulvivirga sp. M361]TRX58780.1 hypothetical protein FNH22_12955 [Fulvivirga sp. M361]
MLKPTQISVWLIASISAFFVSCEQDSHDSLQQQGKLTVNLSLPDQVKTEGRSSGNVTPASILISVEGTTNLTLEKISLYPFEDTYVSEAIALLEGSYELTDFLVLNDPDEVIYATPKSGSEFASVIDVPLPLGFEVSGNSVTKIEPEVLSTLDTSPDKYGYSTFGLNVVETFLVAAIGNGDLVETDLQIWSGGSKLTTDALNPSTNRLAIPSGYDEYTLIIEKQGYARYKKTFSLAQMKAFNDEPLIIHLKPALTITLFSPFDEYNDLKIILFEAGTLYIDYSDYQPADTIEFEAMEWIDIPCPSTDDHYFVSITGDVDKIQSLDNDYNQSTRGINLDHAINLKSLLISAVMDNITFKAGSKIERLFLFGGKINTIDISNIVHQLVLLDISEENGTSSKMISKMLYESLQVNPRFGGSLYLYFNASASDEDKKYMGLIEQEFQWFVSFD